MTYVLSDLTYLVVKEHKINVRVGHHHGMLNLYFGHQGYRFSDAILYGSSKNQIQLCDILCLQKFTITVTTNSNL